MNPLPPKLMLSLMLLVSVALVACGTAEVTLGPDVAATETAEVTVVSDTPTPEPTATPTETPIPTATPEPTPMPSPSPTALPSPLETPAAEAAGRTNLDGVTLTVKDLPAGLVAVPSTMLGLDDLAVPETGGIIVPENIFAFLDQSQFRVVAGFVQELEDEGAIIAFDKAITPTLEMFLQGIGSGLGMQDQIDFQLEVLNGLEEIGDEAVGAKTSIES